MTERRPAEVGEVEYILILSSDKEVSIFVMDRVWEMLSSSLPAFTGISGRFDLFKSPTLHSHTEINKAVLYHQCLKEKKLFLPVVQKEARSTKGH